jgi:hypothetical protein
VNQLPGRRLLLLLLLEFKKGLSHKEVKDCEKEEVARGFWRCDGDWTPLHMTKEEKK